MTPTPQAHTQSDSPLELTVHALPTASGSPANVSAGRWKMLMVLLLCAAPVIASYVTYYIVRPEGRRNYGDLVEQRAMPAGLMGQPIIQGGVVGAAQPELKPLSSLRDQWLLVNIAPANCDAACERRLYVQRQMRESLGRERQRLDWVWLVSDDASLRPELVKALADPTSGGVVWRVKPQDLTAWLQPASGQLLSDHLYVIDPIGNWMMRFPANLEPAKAKRDLERLLRASGAWDTAGRDDATAAKLPLGASSAASATVPTPKP